MKNNFFSNFSTRDKVFFILFIVSIIVTAMSIKKCVQTPDKERIEILLRQSSRYAIAAQQDNNEAVAVLHGDYSAAYFYALTDAYSEKDIVEATGVDLIKFKKQIQDIQDNVTKRLYNSCPKIVPQNSPL